MMTTQRDDHPPFPDDFVNLLLHAGAKADLPVIFQGRCGGFIWDRVGHKVPLFVTYGEKGIQFFGDERSDPIVLDARRNWFNPECDRNVQRCLDLLTNDATLPADLRQIAPFSNLGLSPDGFVRWWSSDEVRQLFHSTTWVVIGGCLNWASDIDVEGPIDSATLGEAAGYIGSSIGSIIGDLKLIEGLAPDCSDTAIRTTAGTIATRIYWRLFHGADRPDPYMCAEENGVLVATNYEFYGSNRWFTSTSFSWANWVDYQQYLSDKSGISLTALRAIGSFDRFHPEW